MASGARGVHLLDRRFAPMKIIEKLASKKPSFSFEFFPPKDEEGKDRLFESISHLQPYDPTFV